MFLPGTSSMESTNKKTPEANLLRALLFERRRIGDDFVKKVIKVTTGSDKSGATQLRKRNSLRTYAFHGNRKVARRKRERVDHVSLRNHYSKPTIPCQ